LKYTLRSRAFLKAERFWPPDMFGLDLKNYDVELSLRATPDSVGILPGNPTELWRYKAELEKGPDDTITECSGVIEIKNC